MIVYLKRSTNPDKKYMVYVDDGKSKKTVHFGASGYSDYTHHKDPERKARYVARHKDKENWGKSGIKTAGFWSLWLLWNKPTLGASIKHTEKKFNIVIKRGWPV
jgi:hypothetical protein